jgi:hypothetical protein
MVSVRRPQYRGRSNSSSWQGLLTLRNGLLLCAALLGLRFFFMTPAPSDTSIPVGIEKTLKESHIRIPNKKHTDFAPEQKKHEKIEPEEPNLADHEEHHEEPLLPEEHHDEPQVKNIVVEPPHKPASPINIIVVDKKGTGPTTVGYVKDFDAERENPPFRSVAIKDTDASQTVASLSKLSVKPCLTQPAGADQKQRQVHPNCLDPDTPLIAYNAAPFPRAWCGQEIPPHATVEMTEHCTDKVVHLFSSALTDETTPSVSGQGMPPIIVKSHEAVIAHDAGSNDLEDVECNIPCKQEKGMQGEVRYIDGTPWKITQTMADAYSSSAAKIERANYRRDFYYSTQSFHSSVPLSFFDFDKDSLRNRPAVDWETASPKGVYLVNSACVANASKRHKYFGAISNVFPVDSFGICGHNADVPEGMTMETPEGRIAIMKQYRIVLAFDATSEKDHISPLIWEAFASGALPVVAGADNMREHLPPNSFIWVGDYSSWDDAAAYVKKVAEDKTLWESYQQWRNDEAALAGVEAHYQFTRTQPTCRLCRWAYAKKYGLGWDHSKQEVQDTKLTRQFCIASHQGLISKPFQEEWVGKNDHDENVMKRDKDASETCPTTMTTEGTIDNDSFQVHRTVVQHDGVTDIIITGVDRDQTDGEVVLRLPIPGVQNSDGAHFLNTHTPVPTTRGPLISSASIQDDFSKVTILADWATSVSSPEEGVMEVVLQKSGEGPIEKGVPKRIRVIIEDMSKLHDKMTEFFPSSFCKQMTKDFVDPLEVFFADTV